MTKQQMVRKQKPAMTDIEKLFKMAVNELMTKWDNNSTENCNKLKGIVHNLRSTQLFPASVHDELESYFETEERFFVEKNGRLVSDSSEEMLNLLSVLDDDTEYKILKEMWPVFHNVNYALNKLIENPKVTLEDIEISLMYGVPATQYMVSTAKQLWNQEVAKANGKPDVKLQNKYAFIIRCIWARSAFSKESEKHRQTDKRYASELYRMLGFDRNIILRKEINLYKHAQQRKY